MAEGSGHGASGQDLAAIEQATLANLADGVLTISPDGRIQSINPAAARLLGLSDEAGGSLREVLPDDGGADDFLDALMAPVSGEAAPEVVGFAAPGIARRLRVRSTAYRLAHGRDAGRLLVTASFTDVTELERLAEREAELARQLREQHQALQGAYRDLEGNAERLRVSGRQLQFVRIGATIGVFALITAAGLYGWTQTRQGLFGEAPSVAASDGITLSPRPVNARIAVVGALDAGALVSVVGPFDGLVRAREFRYGGAVERGAPLITMDTAEVEVRLREARTALIRVQQRIVELRGWANGFEVSRARRQVAAAELEAGDLRTRVGQTAALLARGIIPAEEHRNLLQQQRNQSLQMQAARQDLEATLARGDAENVRIAELELANAEVRVRDLEADVAAAVVNAPVSGVVLLPPEPQGGQRPQTVEVGSRISRGQTMLVIGDLERFQVRAQVDEIDIGKLRVGQPVQVTGDAFAGIALEGRVAAVAAQASAETGRTGLPSFAVNVEIGGIPPESRQRLAVGMSANLSIITYDNPQGFVVPPDAVQEGAEGRLVRLRRGAAVIEVPITIGIAMPDGVEIRGALQAGDVVLMGAAR